MSTTREYGLSAHELDVIMEYLAREPAIERVVLFGSRAMGNYKRGSDIDIALYGRRLDAETVFRAGRALNEETSLPHRFDVIDGERLSNRELGEHIAAEGKLLWQSPNAHTRSD